MIEFICDSSAKEHLLSNIKQYNPLSLTVCEDLSGDNRIKVEMVVSHKLLAKVIDYLKEHYLKQFNGCLLYQTDYFTEV